jgi:hypothetical protein
MWNEGEVEIDVLQSNIYGDVNDVSSFVGWEDENIYIAGLFTSHLQLETERQSKSCWHVPLSPPT